MSENFAEGYASLYDLMYAAKDYAAECDVVESLSRRFVAHPKTVLDLGCGTGGHSLRLAARGYQVVGVDRAPEMLKAAEAKAEESDLNVELHLGDVRTMRLNRRFDLVLMLFAVLGYQTTNNDVLATLETARSHLDVGGILVFDVWYGPAVLINRPEQRFRELDIPAGTILKASSATVDTLTHVADVDMRLWLVRDGRVSASERERHRMRFFFPQELKLFLSQADFELQLLAPFPDVESELDSNSWNVACVATAV